MYTASQNKTERLNLRLDTKAKARIERAAAFAGKSVNAFVLQSAVETAQQTIDTFETMHLERSDAERFLEALDRPFAPNVALSEALELHDRDVTSR
ncbi:DUF1778 domain-containing protein [Tritonibacter mobilis]|uniref:type II toxin-antitoxin system TacA family antitoxin n=1 Tax=Tritonibacter mobilis TaxID=379347 RepID=UPI003A5BEF73